MKIPLSKQQRDTCNEPGGISFLFPGPHGFTGSQ